MDLIEVKYLDIDTGEEITDPKARKWQGRWIIKITWDARQVAHDMHQVEMMLLLIPDGEEGQHYNQSCLRIRTVMVLDGKDSEDNVQANFGDALAQIADLVKHGVRYSNEKDTLLGQCALAKDAQGNVKPVVAGSGDMHAVIGPFMPSDMAAMNALEGHGGMRDKNKHFCSHCYCHLKHRHMPFQLIKVDNDTTVRELALQHEMPENLFWALNAGRDPDGMFTPEELTEEVLGNRTLPLPADPILSAAAPESSSAHPPASAAAAPIRGTVSGVDLGFAGPARHRGAKRSKQPAAQTDPRDGQIKDTRLRSLDMDGVPVNLANVVVHAGMVIRVLQTHRMERRSAFVDRYLILDKERLVLSLLPLHLTHPS